MNPTFIFKEKLWLWSAAKASWHFITVPKDISTEIKSFQTDTKRKGFGSVPVTVTIGSSTWKTSIFPSKEHKAYVLPIKKDVRQKEKLEVGSAPETRITLQ